MGEEIIRGEPNINDGKEYVASISYGKETGKTFRWADTEAAQMNIDQWIGMRDVRDCEHCENYVAWDDRPEIKSCRKWACEYEPLPEPYDGGEQNDA